jgi:Ca-activated chloride channel family protein
VVLSVLVLTPLGAHAEAVLQSTSGTSLFPLEIRIESEISAQVETVTLVFGFADLQSGGDYVLTVPSPRGAYSVGVDLDQGKGMEPLAIQAKTPPPGAGSGPQASPELRAWQGSTPLLARLDALRPGPLTVRVRFLRLLRRHQGRVQFEVGADRCPLRAAGDSPARLTLSVRIRTFRPLLQLQTAGASPKIEKPSPSEASLTLPPTSLSGSVRTTVTYEESTQGVEMHALAHRTPTADPLGGADGYFLLLLDADQLAAEAAPPRSLSLVIDRSGSMQGDKILQARKAALAMLDNLRESDLFNLHTFASTVSSWQSGPVPATAANIAAAKQYVGALNAGGSTDLESAIVAGLGGGSCAGGTTAEDQRYHVMVLLSDGLATAGETGSAAIYQSAQSHNCQQARIFTFAVGQGADVPLLEAISRGARGRNFVLNDAQAEGELAEAVRRLFEDIYAVRVTDLTLTIAGIDTRDVLPEQPVDLFAGGQVVLVGRYATPGAGTARITGQASGAPFAMEIPFAAPALLEDHASIKYVWATEKVGALLAAMATGGDRAELTDQITALGLGYRIQTPFTSFATPPSSSGSGSSGGSYSSGGGYSGGMGGDVNLPTVVVLMVTLAGLAVRRRTGARGHSASGKRR